MDKAIEYIIENWSSLSGAQWLLIILLSLVLGSGIFVFLRWIYSARFQAQDDVIRLKNSVIEEYKRQFIVMRSQEIREEAKLKNAPVVATKEEQLESKAYATEEGQNKEDSQLSNRIFSLAYTASILDMIRINLMIMNNVRSMLMIYTFLGVEHQISNAPRASDLHERLSRLADPYRYLPAFGEQLNLERLEADLIKFQPSTRLRDLPHAEITTELHEIEKDITTPLEQYFAKYAGSSISSS